MKTTFTFLLWLSFFQWLVAQCPQNNITISTQGQVDSFKINYPGCTELWGGMTVSGTDITNLDSFHIIQKAPWLWILNNPGLVNLSGLENLKEVGNKF